MSSVRISKDQAKAMGLVVPKAAKKGPNKWEQEYGRMLEAAKFAGEIRAWGFEEIKFKVGLKTCWYTPDFWRLGIAGDLAFIDVKGFLRDDAAVKIKSAAKQYPHFKFWLARKVNGRWELEEVA